jgi:hypothetical protein
MGTVIKASEFAKKLRDIALSYKTLYVMGCFGAPMNAANKKRYCNNHSYNKQPARQRMINAASDDTFGFDCVCLLKGVMWGWNGDKTKTYGGAGYAVNGVPDIGADSMINVCSNVSSDFSNILVGEAVWVKGHIGLYVGDGLAVECTPAWKNKVQITAVGNIGTKAGYNTRKWTKHGKLPYVQYDVGAETAPVQPSTPAGKFKVGDIVRFTGNKHYTSANSTSPKSCRAGEAKVTAVYNGKHPYHLIHTGKDSDVYGWVDAADVQSKTPEKPVEPPKTGYTVGADNEHTCYNFFTEVMGLNTAAACGVLANINAESGFRPNALGDGGTSYGICQWHNTRWTRLKDWCAKNGKDDTTLDGQLWFLKYELESFYSSVLSTIKRVENSSQGAYDAAYCWCVKFEVPTNKETAGANRGSSAKRFYERYSGTTSEESPAPQPTTKVDYAQKFDKALAGKYKVSASSGLHLRAGAGTAKVSLDVLRSGEVVNNYGYYSVAADGTKWLYVKTADGKLGFCSSRYLAKC